MTPPMKTDPQLRAVAEGLTRAQRALILASEPDDITGREGCGVDIRGSQYKTAKSLDSAGYGHYTHGSFIADMYWNNALGLALRNHLRAQEGSAGGEDA